MANAQRRVRKTPTKLSMRGPERERSEWEAANREAIDAYNERVDTHGVFSDGWRKF